MSLTAVALALATSMNAPAPDYRAEVGARLAAEVRQLASAEGLDSAMARAAEIEDQLGPLVAVRYEAALARNQAGAIRPAIQAYGRVLELNPDHVGALYDRGELLVVAGTPEDRVQARADLDRAESLRPDHWAIPYRLALLSGQDGDAEGMITALTRSLRAGLDLGLLATDPAWTTLLGAPTTGPAIVRFARTYGSEALSRELDKRAGESP
jgi:tetratricopeptide (TPR) repeat protein